MIHRVASTLLKDNGVEVGVRSGEGGESCVRVYVNIGNILQWFNSIIFVTT